MIINLHMTDGHTMFQIASRGDLRKLLGIELAEDCRPVDAFVRWHVDDQWKPIRVSFIRKASVAFSVSAEDQLELGLPAQMLVEEKERAWEERQLEKELVEESEPAEVA